MKHKNNLGVVVKTVIKTNKILTAGMIALILCTIVFAMFSPLVLENIINRLTDTRKIAVGLAVLYFITLAAAGLFEAAQNVAITVFGQKITHQLRKRMCEKLSRLPASYFTANEPGKITSRFVNDADAIDALFTNGVISMFADACKVISIIGIIFWKSTGLGILMILITPVLFVVTRVFQKRMLKAQLANRAAISKVNNHIPETIRNIRMIHTLFRQKYMEKRYDSYIRESYSAMEKSNLYESLYSPIIIFMSSCVVAVMMVMSAMGGQMQTFFGMSVGTAVAVIAYVDKVFTPLESIGMEIQNIQSAAAGVRRINEFLMEKELTPSQHNVTAPKTDIISFKNVTFGYNPDEPVLENLSFTVKAGETATLTGRTGAGKSTILRLLTGLYAPEKGKITVFGMSPEGIPENVRRTLFGYVEQSFQLLSGTVADQITMFDSSINRTQIEHATQLTGIHESIMALEQGYDTLAADISFSQGQMQLLSIARAIVTDPQILLLDEITANLDSETEHNVMEALKNASENRTVLSVSHRLYQQTMKGIIIPIE